MSSTAEKEQRGTELSLNSDRESQLRIRNTNHGILEWPGLEGTLNTIPFHPCHGQGHLPLAQVAPSPSNLALDTARDPGAATAALGTLC